MHEICLLVWLPWSHSHERTTSDTQPRLVDMLPVQCEVMGSVPVVESDKPNQMFTKHGVWLYCVKYEN